MTLCLQSWHMVGYVKMTTTSSNEEKLRKAFDFHVIEIWLGVVNAHQYRYNGKLWRTVKKTAAEPFDEL